MIDEGRSEVAGGGVARLEAQIRLLELRITQLEYLIEKVYPTERQIRLMKALSGELASSIDVLANSHVPRSASGSEFMRSHSDRRGRSFLRRVPYEAVAGLIAGLLALLVAIYIFSR